MAEIGLFEAIYTQRAIRRFKPDPVPDDVIKKVLEAATKAPSGGNRQPWSFIVIRDRETKRKIGEYYKQAFNAAYGPSAPLTPQQQPVRRAATSLADGFADVPVFIMVCIRLDAGAGRAVPGSLTVGASIYPAVQNLLLAARGLGLGTTLTTLHKRFENEVGAILGIPDNVETAALIPLGYPRGRFGPNQRDPVENFTFYEKWGHKAPSR